MGLRVFEIFCIFTMAAYERPGTMLVKETEEGTIEKLGRQEEDIRREERRGEEQIYQVK